MRSRNLWECTSFHWLSCPSTAASSNRAQTVPEWTIQPGAAICWLGFSPRFFFEVTISFDVSAPGFTPSSALSRFRIISTRRAVPGNPTASFESGNSFRPISRAHRHSLPLSPTIPAIVTSPRQTIKLEHRPASPVSNSRVVYIEGASIETASAARDSQTVTASAHYSSTSIASAGVLLAICRVRSRIQ